MPASNSNGSDKAIRKLINRYQLHTVEIVVTSDRAYARALPAHWSKLVSRRIEAAFAAAEGSLSLHEATEIRERCYGPVATAAGADIAAAVAALTTELGKTAAE